MGRKRFCSMLQLGRVPGAAVVFGWVVLLGCSGVRVGGMRPATHCGPSAAELGGVCEIPPSPVYRIPFPDGTETVLNQGYYGASTHQGAEAFAFDFACNEGDTIVAARGGGVLDAEGGIKDKCEKSDCAFTANTVIIDHGDGTYATYSHLLAGGVRVARGDRVVAGDVIAACGSTGHATGPHLHFAVSDAAHRTFPVEFSPSSGMPFLTVGSHLIAKPVTDTYVFTAYSLLSTYAFAHQGILLDKPMSMNMRRGGSQGVGGRFVDPSWLRRRKALATGRQWVDSRRGATQWNAIAIHTASHSIQPTPADGWQTTCFPLQKDGRFEGVVTFPKSFPPNGDSPLGSEPSQRVAGGPSSASPRRMWLMVTPAMSDMSESGARSDLSKPGGCRSAGWSWAYVVYAD